ncbi:MAG: radical SAM protein [Exilispira sp.]
MNKNKGDEIGVSSLTASILGLKNINTDAISEQAYLMFGTRCLNDCAFCSQSRNSKSEAKMLSRVSWPSFPADIVIESIQKNNFIKKACFQVVGTYNYFENFIDFIKKFKSHVNIPVGASIDVGNLDQIDILFQNGISNIGIAIDAASEEIYNKIKRKSITYEKTLNLILEACKKYPFKITVHLIIGLGETDVDIINLFKIFENYKINIALFAFTPVKGTEMESYPYVDLNRYRKIQFLRQILTEKIGFNEIIKYINIEENKIKSFSKKLFEIPYIYEILKKGDYLKTSGCKLCNRPYYNDKPVAEDLYNYHFDPPEKIIEKWKQIISQSN